MLHIPLNEGWYLPPLLDAHIISDYVAGNIPWPARHQSTRTVGSAAGIQDFHWHGRAGAILIRPEATEIDWLEFTLRLWFLISVTLISFAAIFQPSLPAHEIPEPPCTFSPHHYPVQACRPHHHDHIAFPNWNICLSPTHDMVVEISFPL